MFGVIRIKIIIYINIYIHICLFCSFFFHRQHPREATGPTQDDKQSHDEAGGLRRRVQSMPDACQGNSFFTIITFALFWSNCWKPPTSSHTNAPPHLLYTLTAPQSERRINNDALTWSSVSTTYKLPFRRRNISRSWGGPRPMAVRCIRQRIAMSRLILRGARLWSTNASSGVKPISRRKTSWNLSSCLSTFLVAW